MFDRVVIVGASLAGMQAAQGLRRGGFAGELIVVGEEPDLPYDRPPLSKGFLDGSVSEEKLRLRPAADPDALAIDWRLGVRAESLDVERRSLVLSDGTELIADGVIVATGSRARTLPGMEADGVYVLRNVAHARALMAAFAARPNRVVIIGAGFIGAEVAATARAMGLEVTMVEAASVPLARVLDPTAGMAVAELHQSHGVDVRLGVGLDGIEVDANGSLQAVQLSDGSRIDTTTMLLGVGALPNVEWLEGSGVCLDHGIVCDETLLAAPNVVAAGDVARWPHPRFGGELIRIEQWDNAVEQGAYAAKRLLALATDDEIEPFGPVPWFWSDQYDRKIQLAGRADVSAPGARAEIVNGSIAEGVFLQLYGDGEGRLTGALGWNRPRHTIKARMLMADGVDFETAKAELSD